MVLVSIRGLSEMSGVKLYFSAKSMADSDGIFEVLSVEDSSTDRRVCPSGRRNAYVAMYHHP